MLLGAKPDEIENLIERPLRAASKAAAAELCYEQVVLHREPLERIRPLKLADHATAAEFVGTASVHGRAGNPHFAIGRPRCARQQADQRTLAGAVRSDDAGQLIAPDREVDVAHGNNAAV